MPDWPPSEDSFYEAELKSRKYRKVRVEEWEWVDETKDGRAKVYELCQFRGVFRNSANELIDLRPMDSCPCHANLMKKPLGNIYAMLVQAYENQIKDLDNSLYDETRLKAELKTRLNHWNKQAATVAVSKMVK